ncbi:MAG: hypothetical protein SFV22_09705 [Saprospiraceae bacterium]|nr:hypothetical protein [Saprospiraceae bacterium]
MQRLVPPSFLLKHATGRNVLLGVFLFVAFAGFIMPAMENDIKALSGGVGVIDLEFFYTPARALEMLSTYGPEGIYLYLIAQWTVDLIFPIVGFFMFSVFLIWLGLARWWWLGAFIMLTDWIENVFITIMLIQYPAFSPELAVVSCVFTMMKWSGIFFSNALILFNGGKKLLAARKTAFKQSNSLR